MIEHNTLSESNIMKLVRNGSISHAGNAQLKIFGKLNCKSGKRMKKENRVFFKNRDEAFSLGFRPCGHCLNSEYKNWKNGII